MLVVKVYPHHGALVVVVCSVSLLQEGHVSEMLPVLVLPVSRGVAGYIPKLT